MNDKNIQFLKLQRHIEMQHPTKTRKLPDNTSEQVPFGVCENLGTLSPIKALLGQTTPMARQLGVGPSLFLLSTKAFAWFFFFLTILHIPIFRYYYYGRQDAEQGSSGSFFTDYSLGNVGSSHVVCGVSRYAGVIYGFNQAKEDWFDTNKTVSLACSDGAVLGEIIQFGLTRNSSSSCGTVQKFPHLLKT